MKQTAASQAWRVMRRLMMQGEGHRQVLQACSDAGLTPGMLKMALQLSTDRPQSMRELADRFHCDASYVTSLVDGLEQQDIAERRPHPRDRRIKTVVLTEHGKEALDRVDAVLDQAPAAFDVLTDSEQVQLRDLLQRVSDAAGALEDRAQEERAHQERAAQDAWVAGGLSEGGSGHDPAQATGSAITSATSATSALG